MSNYPQQNDPNAQQRAPGDPFNGQGQGQRSAGHSYEDSGESDEYDRNRDTYTSEEGSADAQGRDRGDYSESWALFGHERIRSVMGRGPVG